MSHIAGLENLHTVDDIDRLTEEDIHYRLVQIGSVPLQLSEYLLNHGERSFKMRLFRKLIRRGSKLWAIPPYYVINFCLLLKKPLDTIMEYADRFPEIRVHDHYTLCLSAQQGRLDYFIWARSSRPLYYNKDYWSNAKRSGNRKLIELTATLPSIGAYRETIEMVQINTLIF